MKEYHTYEGMKGRHLGDYQKEIVELSKIHQKYDEVVGVSYSKSNAHSAMVFDDFGLSYENYVCDESLLHCRGANLDSLMIEKFEDKNEIKPIPAKNLDKHQPL